MHGYPQFYFWIPVAIANVCFSRIVINCAKILVLIGTVLNYLSKRANTGCQVVLVLNEVSVTSQQRKCIKERIFASEILTTFAIAFALQGEQHRMLWPCDVILSNAIV